jgi:hypothetical protein
MGFGLLAARAVAQHEGAAGLSVPDIACLLGRVYRALRKLRPHFS